MKLVSVQVRKFRNILDSEPVEIQPDVTCMVGKNEAGKSAFLHALYRLRPARTNAPLSARKQYPAWLLKADERAGVDIDAFRPIVVQFELSDEDVKVVTEALGPGVLKGKTFGFERAYKGNGTYHFQCDEKMAVANLLADLSLPTPAKDKAAKCTTLAALRETAAELAKEEDTADAGKVISDAVAAKYGAGTAQGAAWKALEPRVPRFFYFHEYATLPYSVNVKEILTTDEEKLNDDMVTALALLRMAGADDDYLMDPDYEERKRELEHVANALTSDVLKYWSQNPTLRVLPDITQTTVTNPQGQQAVVDELKIRIWDERHMLSLPFNEHSTGFRWFFSFLAAFSDFEMSKEPVIILLDEPALGLHARAQADFLRFIDERLAQEGRQVIYTTHSPFMVQSGKLERVRLVEDKGREEGTKITANVLSTDRDTLFPLQGALGYDIAQHLLIGDHNLVVEGTSDFTYLTALSSYFEEQGGREILDPRWSILPVGGINQVPTFVALLGNHLDVTVVIDAQRAGHQRLDDMATDGILEQNRIITIGQVLGRKFADVEDLFDPVDYLSFFNPTFGKTYAPGDLKGNDPITNQLAREMGIERYDHGKPADRFLRKRDEILPKLSTTTLDNFEALFKAINATLEDEAPTPAPKRKKKKPR